MELENVLRNEISFCKILYFDEGQVFDKIAIIDARNENIVGESLSEELFWYTHPLNWALLMRTHLIEIAEARMTMSAIKVMMKIAEFSIPYVALPEFVVEFKQEFRNAVDTLVKDHDLAQIESLLKRYQQIRRNENGDESLFRLC